MDYLIGLGALVAIAVMIVIAVGIIGCVMMVFIKAFKAGLWE